MDEGNKSVGQGEIMVRCMTFPNSATPRSQHSTPNYLLLGGQLRAIQALGHQQANLESESTVQILCVTYSFYMLRCSLNPATVR